MWHDRNMLDHCRLARKHSWCIYSQRCILRVVGYSESLLLMCMYLKFAFYFRSIGLEYEYLLQSKMEEKQLAYLGMYAGLALSISQIANAKIIPLWLKNLFAFSLGGWHLHFNLIYCVLFVWINTNTGNVWYIWYLSVRLSRWRRIFVSRFNTVTPITNISWLNKL